MKRVVWLLGIILGVALFAGGWLAGQRWPSSRSAAPSPLPPPTSLLQPARVLAQGRILPAGGIFNIVIPPGQRLETLNVQEGSVVQRGETELAVLQAAQVLETQVALTDAQNDLAARELSQKILAAEANVAAARASEEAAKLQTQQAERAVENSAPQKKLAAAREQRDRLLALQSDPLTRRYVSAATVSDQTQALATAELEWDLAQEQLRGQLAAARLAERGAGETRERAEAALHQLRELQAANSVPDLSRQLANEQLQNSRLIAPCSGTVLKIFLKPGESAVNTPLLQIGNLESLECVAEVVDRLVGQVQIGQSAQLAHPALEQPLRGRVTQIGRLVGNSTLLEPSPLALVDRRTVEVRIAIDPADVPRVQRLINLQVTVNIDTTSASDSQSSTALPRD